MERGRRIMQCVDTVHMQNRVAVQREKVILG